jgi:hypothetical protein
VYDDNSSPVLNTINAVNLNAGAHHFDFSYPADQDEALILTHVRSGPLIGCDNSDIGLDFRLYNLGSDGNVDLSTYQGIPQSVGVGVKRGQRYVARVIFQLNKGCLGISYQFGIHVVH